MKAKRVLLVMRAASERKLTEGLNLIADDPSATFWTKPLWFAETMAIGNSTPLVFRKRGTVLRSLIENEGFGDEYKSITAAERLRIAGALHALATEFDCLPAHVEVLRNLIGIANRRLLLEEFDTADAARDAIIALCRANAIAIDEERTDPEIRSGHAKRRAILNRAARRVPRTI